MSRQFTEPPPPPDPLFDPLFDLMMAEPFRPFCLTMKDGRVLNVTDKHDFHVGIVSFSLFVPDGTYVKQLREKLADVESYEVISQQIAA